eukprot:1362828-Pleurochrysis_carterae.AAC.1
MRLSSVPSPAWARSQCRYPQLLPQPEHVVVTALRPAPTETAPSDRRPPSLYPLLRCRRLLRARALGLRSANANTVNLSSKSRELMLQISQCDMPPLRASCAAHLLRAGHAALLHARRQA